MIAFDYQDTGTVLGIENANGNVWLMRAGSFARSSINLCSITSGLLWKRPPLIPEIHGVDMRPGLTNGVALCVP